MIKLLIQEAHHCEDQVLLTWRVQMSVYNILHVTGVRVYFKTSI